MESHSLPGLTTHRPFAPVDLKGTAAFTALVRLFAHRIFYWHGEQFTAVRAVDLCGTGDGSREAEFVGDEVVEEGLRESIAFRSDRSGCAASARRLKTNRTLAGFPLFSRDLGSAEFFDPTVFPFQNTTVIPTTILS